MTPELLREAEVKLSCARAILRAREPYICPTVYGFIPHPQPGLGTMGVTKGMVLYYDPEWLVTLTDEQVAAALRHECDHHVRDHADRCAAYPNKDLANISADLAINPDLRNANWELPHGVFPENYSLPEQLPMEEYYDLLSKPKESPPANKQQKQEQNSKEEKQQQGGGQEEEEEEKDGGEQPEGEQGQEGDDKEKSPGQKPACCSGGCGGIAGNPITGLEEELDEQYGRATSEVKNIARETAQEIKNHVAKHGRGSVPGSLLEAVDQLLDNKSKVHWTKELAHILKKATGRIEAGGMDFSLSHPSKRSFARGFPRPGLVQYLPEIAFVLDTSGSMGTEQIQAAILQTVGIFRGLGVESAWFVQADAAVAAAPKRVRLRDLKKIEIAGRGGTSFDPALQVVQGLQPRPDLVVYLTDGDGAATVKPKGIEVVWCIVPARWGRKPDANFGHVVVIEEDGSKKRA